MACKWRLPLNKPTNYREILTEDEDLATFLRQMAKFDRKFCELMADGVDFTLKMELHGNKGRLIHCRVFDDSWDRPKGSERLVDSRNNRKTKITADWE
jgi:hypothetical protein